jgi:hypothetical protein
MEGEPVLVVPADSTDNPAVGMRGSIRVAPHGQVDLELQFADMYDRPAEMKRIRLNSRQVARLWASKAAYGGYAVRLDGPLDAPPTGERVVGRFGRGRPETRDTHNARPLG